MKRNFYPFLQIAGAYILLFLLFYGCKKDNPIETVSPPDPPLNETVDGATGLKQITKEQYEKLPLYVPRTTVNQAGRTSAIQQKVVSLDVPPVGNQQQLGSCNAFATTYAIRSYLHHMAKKTSYLNGNQIDLQSVFSPNYVYNQINGGYDSGSRPEAAFDLMMREGVCTWKDMPYVNNHLIQPNAGQRQQAANYKLNGWGRTLINVENFKQCISNGIPVYVAMYMVALKSPATWGSSVRQVGGEYIWHSEGNTINSNYHAMVIVGYDDDMQAFKVMNSWGDRWANKGFIWVDYKMVDNGAIHESFIAFDARLEPSVVKYNGFMYTGSGTWKQLSTPSGYAMMGSGFVNSGKLCILASRQDRYSTLSYNFSNSKWDDAQLEPSSGINSFVSGSEFQIGDKAYLVAEDNGRFYEFDIKNNKWSRKPDLTFDKVGNNWYKRANAVTFIRNGKGYYGLNPQNLSYTQSSNAKGGELWEYEPTTNSWNKKTTMPLDWIRGGGASALIGDKLYSAHINSIGGGEDAAAKSRSTMMYLYDFGANSWTEKARLPMKMAGGFREIAVGLNGRMYLHSRVADGATGLPDSPLQRLFVYNPSDDTWTEVKASPCTKLIYSAVVYNNKIYVAYQDPPYNITNSLEWWEYTP